jgi:hypothetical protein
VWEVEVELHEFGTAGIDSGSEQLYVPAALPPAPKDSGPCIHTYVLDRHNNLAGLLLIIIRRRVVRSRTVCSHPTCLQLDNLYYNTIPREGRGRLICHVMSAVFISVQR